MADDVENGSSARFPGYVCVQNRNRDNYEVPLALADAGLLACLVTDFYARPVVRRFLPGFLARRFRRELPANRTRMGLASFCVQYVGQALRLPMHRVFATSDRLLGESAIRLARRRGAGLFAYSSYLPADPQLGPDRPVIDFEYHPHPALSLEILADDARRHPEVAWSFALEQETAKRQKGSEAWRWADSVVCASTMTRRSLEYAGCPPDRIAVIPYGVGEPSAPVQRRPEGPCRFLFVGQGIQRKGLHHLALAWRQAGIADAELTVVAYRIDPGIRTMLEQPGIRLLGQQDRAALDRLFAAADVFVMPSLVEGFGLVYLEALQAGCHIVGTDNTGLPDLQLSDDAATILPCGDIAAIAAAIRRLAASKAQGGLDPALIAAEAARWRWPDFRRALAEHAGTIAASAMAGAARHAT